MNFIKRYKRLVRFREIINILSRHGFGFLIDQLDIKEKIGIKNNPQNINFKISTARRLRLALEELGPSFIKIGQLLSTRPDIIPDEFIKELILLQDSVTPFPFNLVIENLEKELGVELNSIFETIINEPLASASIGQVHRGKLLNGEHIIIKIQRPDIEKTIEMDLAIILDLARLLEEKTMWGKFYKPRDMVEEFARAIREEIDYSIEGRNAERFRNDFIDDKTVYFPKVYWEYSTNKVLVLEYIDGIKINDISALDKQGYDKEEIVRNTANCLFTQIYINGFYHADPHPGNLAVMVGQKVAFMDFGMVGKLNEDLKETFVNMILVVIRRDSDGIAEILINLGQAKGRVKKSSLKVEIDGLINKYYDIPLSDLKIGDIMLELMNLAFNYKIKIPREITLLSKTLIILDGIIYQLAPNITILDLAEPFGRKLLKHKYSKARIKKKLMSHLTEVFYVLSVLPRKFDHLLSQVQEGDIELKLQVKEFENLIQRLTLVSNRLSLSIIIAALIIGTSLILRNKTGSILLKLPLADIGFVIAVILGIWLIISIIRYDKK